MKLQDYKTFELWNSKIVKLWNYETTVRAIEQMYKDVE